MFSTTKSFKKKKRKEEKLRNTNFELSKIRECEIRNPNIIFFQKKKSKKKKDEIEMKIQFINFEYIT